MNTILHGDCIEHLSRIETSTVDLVFTDPPYNIGYEYDDYDDNLEPEDYIGWCDGWIAECNRVLKPTGSFWLAISDEYVSELDVLCKNIGFKRKSWIIWYYTFGVNCRKNFSRSHTHLLYYVKNTKIHTFNAESIGVPSARQLVYNDKRAAGLRLPDNTWILRPQEIEAFTDEEDTWHFPRVCGTHKERIPGSANQLPEKLCERVILVSSNQNDVVLDPFGGTGTIAYVANRLKRQYITIELSLKWVDVIRKRLEG
jgi:DNA modification methylase